MLSQKKRLKYTSVSSLFLQVATMVCGFVLPRFFLECYGSAINGLVSSITQFLVFVALAECGVGAVVQSALYKPLSQKDNKALSKIIVSAERFFQNIAKILLLYVVVLILVFPFLTKNSFDFLFTASLIVIISISSFAQYYFGITYRLLLNSDQFGFIPIVIQLTALVLNCVISVFLMKMGCSVHFVKLVSSLIFVIQPLTVSFIARKKYKIDHSIPPDKNAIEQKWNGLAQHISAVILQCSGTVVLSLLSTMQIVSVYSIYFLVVNGIKSITMSLTNGMQAFLGNLYAQNDMTAFCKSFEIFEHKIHFFVTIVFSITSVLIVPFVSVYTKGISDVNYVLPAFGVILSAAWGMYCIRLPYNVAVLSVGHYRQTQGSAIVEAVLNVFISVIFVLKWGIVGVAIGTLFAMFYRTFYLARYVSKNITQKSFFTFLKHLFVDFVSITLFVSMLKVFNIINGWTAPSVSDWFITAIKVFIPAITSTLFSNAIFFKSCMFQKCKKR